MNPSNPPTILILVKRNKIKKEIYSVWTEHHTSTYGCRSLQRLNMNFTLCITKQMKCITPGDWKPCITCTYKLDIREKKNEDAYERTMMIIIVAQGTSYKHRCRPLGFSKKEVGYHRPMAVVLSYSHTIDCHHCPSMKK